MPPKPQLSLPPGVQQERNLFEEIAALRLSLVNSIGIQLAAADYTHALQIRDDQIIHDRDEAERLGAGDEFPPDDYQMPDLNLQFQLVAEIAEAYADHILERQGILLPKPPGSSTTELTPETPPHSY